MHFFLEEQTTDECCLEIAFAVSIGAKLGAGSEVVGGLTRRLKERMENDELGMTKVDVGIFHHQQ